MTFIFAALAVLVESLVGYPSVLQKKIGHPVQWMGAVIAKYDTLLNTKTTEQVKGRTEGAMALLVLLLLVGLPALFLQAFLSTVPYGWVINVAVATSLIATKSLRDHVSDVFVKLGCSLPEARTSVAKIVGRDPSELDDSGVAKAALESLAENSSDGIVAPALWYALLGLPGLAMYKAINTADSMIGHKSETYIHFGWAAAKLDDLVNLPASRLTAVLFAAAAWMKTEESGKQAWRTALRDAGKHNSPNAGWPEAAMAGALGVSFGGNRSYAGETVALPTMGDGRNEFTRADIQSGLSIYDTACILLAALLATIGAILSAPWASLLP